MKFFLSFALLITQLLVCGQSADSLLRFTLFNDVFITIDIPVKASGQKETMVIFFALPNGNTIEQTMGKLLKPGDDWHFDIQHIKAQTKFLRQALPSQQVVVAYLGNQYKSWPQWKSKHPNYVSEVQQVVDTVYHLFKGKKTLYLNGHSGGGRFIFSYLDGVQEIPAYVKNISFLDSNYGYDSTYKTKLVNWLQRTPDAHLNVFAYNDSVALLDGKRIVSDTGGTWYRSHLMLRQLSSNFTFHQLQDDSLQVYQSTDHKITSLLKTNPDKAIFHTQQVERNGFIHSILIGTKKENKGYRYFSERAYGKLIE